MTNTNPITPELKTAGQLHYVGETPTDEQREHCMASGLFDRGDCWLIWVNEGDLCELEMQAAQRSAPTDIEGLSKEYTSEHERNFTTCEECGKEHDRRQRCPSELPCDYDEVDAVIARLETTDSEAASYLKATDRELAGERERNASLNSRIEALQDQLEELRGPEAIQTIPAKQEVCAEDRSEIERNFVRCDDCGGVHDRRVRCPNYHAGMMPRPR